MTQLQKNVSEQQNEQKKEYLRNEAIRAKIAKAIDEYKVKEDDYKAKMEVHNQKINSIQSDLSKQLRTGPISKVVKECEKEKAAYNRVTDDIDRASKGIEGYIKKFDEIKNDITERSKLFETYKMEIENKKLQIQLLETEI